MKNFLITTVCFVALIVGASFPLNVSSAQFIDRIIRPCGSGATPRAQVIANPNSTGNVTITTCSGGSLTLNGVAVVPGGTPGGANTQVQFNDAGAFGGDAGLVYDKTTDTLSVGAGGVAPNAGVSASLGQVTLPWASLRIGNDPGGNNITITGTATAARLQTLPDLAGTFALLTNNLGSFAATTSAQMRTVISDENGTGAALFNDATSPTFITGLTVTKNDAITNVPSIVALQQSTGDASVAIVISGVQAYAMGIDNSASDIFTISDTTATNDLATSPRLTITTAGVVTAVIGFVSSGTSTLTGNTTMSVGQTTSAQTDLLINPTTKASGNLINAQVNSVSKFKVDFAGVGTFSGATFSAVNASASFDIVTVGANRFFGFVAGSRIGNSSDGVLALYDNAQATFNRLQFGGTTSSFPALARSTVFLKAQLADGTEGGGFLATTYSTVTNCADSAGAAACGSASAGSVVIDAGATTVVVSTTSVTANSQVFVQYDSSLGTRLGVTCNVTPALPAVTARTAATSFTVTVPVAPITDPACYSYRILN